MPPLERVESEISTPVNRIRWASKRVTDKQGVQKRASLLRRLHMRSGSGEKKHSRAASAASKRTSTADTALTGGSGGAGGGANPPSRNGNAPERTSNEESATSEEDESRRVFFNIPLPEDARDENGRPIAHFARNKIRTAKYTPISFIPKNLYYQFHNVANMYFLFIIILGVSRTGCRGRDADAFVGL